jgi:hypothetical protein
MWLPSDVPLAEPQLFEEYNKYSLVQACSHGWTGSEGPELQAKYPGLKKAFDQCAKYHNGQKPEDRAGWYYVYGTMYGLIADQVFKNTLEKTGYAGFTTTELREQLFGLNPVETGGLMPTYSPTPFATYVFFKIVDVKNGHMVAKDGANSWLGMPGTKIYPNWKMTVTKDWEGQVWQAPGYK